MLTHIPSSRGDNYPDIHGTPGERTRQARPAHPHHGDLALIFGSVLARRRRFAKYRFETKSDSWAQQSPRGG